MSAGMTIADLVQQVYYAIYKIRLDVNQGVDDAFHSNTDKFKEVVMEANFVIQELQKEQDWNWLRERIELGHACNPCHGIQEIQFLTDDIYKPCTGFNDAVRLHNCHNMALLKEIPWTSPRSGNHRDKAMFDQYGRINPVDSRINAFQVGDTLTFTRRWNQFESGLLIETDVIRRMKPLHICDDSCEPNCPLAYEEKVFTEVPDPYYLVVRTAARKAEGDPSVSERVQSLTDEAQKILSAMRENDSAHTIPDTYQSVELGYVSVL